MLEHLLTEQRNPASADIDSQSTEQILRIINDEDKTVALAVEGAIPAVAGVVDQAVKRLRGGGRLYYIGAGTSGRLGVLDASECPPTYGVSYEMVQGIIAGGPQALYQATEASEDSTAKGEEEIAARGITAADVLVGIAASGRTPYVLGAIRKARSLRALTVGISCTPQSELSREAEYAVEVLTGPEVVTGSTRMKAGTATKLVLNMISSAIMIRLGYVYGNLMVNVQPKNAKLVDRAVRIVAEASAVERELAARLLAEAGSVKAAIIMAKLRVDRAEAERLLAGAEGVIRLALAAHSGPAATGSGPKQN
ncbi:MAG TPA: N-acetylmuramic acid 6-phosphate etherase [Bryobacteraceae bacterium]|nr:N-acetylmuramic acid 6-phosphate etherase [Bryobacteraceae bacterium]